MLRVKVPGGANSGIKLPLKEQRSDSWECSEGHQNKSWWTRCLTKGCNERRP